MQYSLLWFQPYLEKRTQEFQIIQCPSASYHYPCLSLFSCKEWAEGQVGTLNMASCPPCRGNMCIDLPVKHLWVTVSSALGNSRLPDIRSFAQEHGCKVSEIVQHVNHDLPQQPSMPENHAFYLRLLAGFQRSWWLTAVIIMSLRTPRDDWGFIVLLQRSGFWAQA